jgi:hypothetical protein
VESGEQWEDHSQEKAVDNRCALPVNHHRTLPTSFWAADDRPPTRVLRWERPNQTRPGNSRAALLTVDLG